MTVGELRAFLEELPEELEIVVRDEDGDGLWMGDMMLSVVNTATAGVDTKAEEVSFVEIDVTDAENIYYTQDNLH